MQLKKFKFETNENSFRAVEDDPSWKQMKILADYAWN